MPESNPFVPEEKIVPPSENIGEQENPGKDDEKKIVPLNIEDCQTEKEVLRCSEAIQHEASEKKLERLDKLRMWWDKLKTIFPDADENFEMHVHGESDDSEVTKLIKAYKMKEMQIENDFQAIISENHYKVADWEKARQEKESKKLH